MTRAFAVIALLAASASCAGHGPRDNSSPVGGEKADGLEPFSMQAQNCQGVGATASFNGFTVRYPMAGLTFASSTAFLQDVDAPLTAIPTDSSALPAVPNSWGASNAIMELSQRTELYDLEIRLVDSLDDGVVRGLVTYTSDGPIFTDFVECTPFPFDEALEDDPSCGDVGQEPCDDRRFGCDNIGYIMVGGLCEAQSAAESSQGPWGCDQVGDECCLDDDEFEFCAGTTVGCNRDAGVCDLVENLDEENL